MADDAAPGPDEQDPWADPDPDPGGADARLAEPLEHLQRAAREVIAASRALLDVAEELVEDPKAAGSVVDALGSLVKLAGRASRPGRPSATDDEGDDDEDPGVQRIPIS